MVIKFLIVTLLLFVSCTPNTDNRDLPFTANNSNKESLNSFIEKLSKAKSTKYNIVLISIDTLRPDHLGLYGYKRNTSPKLDSWAKNATIFKNAYSTSCLTLESHTTMFTSLYPETHNHLTIEAFKSKRKYPLNKNITTLAEILQKNHYKTASFNGGGFLADRLGLGQGFQKTVSMRNKPPTPLKQAISWLKNLNKNDKFFLFYHTYSIHDPYIPEKKFKTLYDKYYKGKISTTKGIYKFQESLLEDWDSSKRYWKNVDFSNLKDIFHLEALYDAAIRSTDSSIAYLLKIIQQTAPNTIVFIVSDHGEEFAEHGGFTHETLFEEIIKVVFILKHPALKEGITIDTPISLIDLTPTILDLLNISSINQFQGKSLLDSHLKASKQAIFSEKYLNKNFTTTSLKFEWVRSLIYGKYKLIMTSIYPARYRFHFFDLNLDPKEKNNLYGKHPQEFKTLFDLLFAFIHQNKAKNLELKIKKINKDNEKLKTPKNNPDVLENIKKLKSLGYI